VAATRHSVNLVWNANIDASSFRIDYSMDKIMWSGLADNIPKSGGGKYTVNGLMPATTYYFAIFSHGNDGTISVSSTVSSGVMTKQLPEGVNILYSNVTNTVTENDTQGPVRITIPSYAILGDFATSYMIINVGADTSFESSELTTGSKQLVSGSMVEPDLYNIYGVEYSGNFAKQVTLALSYSDSNNDGIVDGVTPLIRAESLRIYRYNPSTFAWEIVQGSQILDKTGKTVSVNLDHYSIYALAAISTYKTDLDNVIVYPNPYEPGTGGRFDNSVFGEGVIFENLTQRARIRIFNIAGELVADLEETYGNGRCIWDIRNPSGDKVASGVYIYYITNPDDSSQKAKGKIAILK
jgi:hypothetical protein